MQEPKIRSKQGNTVRTKDALEIFLLTPSSGFFENTVFTQASLVVQTVKNPPAMQETRM